jgi:hypothetical protein
MLLVNKSAMPLLLAILSPHAVIMQEKAPLAGQWGNAILICL